MKYTNDLVPILSNEEMELEAEKFLKKFYPKALEVAGEVPIECIAESKLGLHLDYMHLSEDLSILGMMVFSKGKVEVYQKETDEFVYQTVEKDTILIDPDLYTQGGIGRERFTIAHEVVHWYAHGFRFAVLAKAEEALTIACKGNQPRSFKARTPEEWLEVQADKIAAAILMPRDVFRQEAHRLSQFYREDTENFLKGWIGYEGVVRQFVVEELSRCFKVSRTAAAIRLKTLDLTI